MIKYESEKKKSISLKKNDINFWIIGNLFFFFTVSLSRKISRSVCIDRWTGNTMGLGSISGNSCIIVYYDYWCIEGYNWRWPRRTRWTKIVLCEQIINCILEAWILLQNSFDPPRRTFDHLDSAISRATFFGSPCKFASMSGSLAVTTWRDACAFDLLLLTSLACHSDFRSVIHQYKIYRILKKEK